MVLDSHILMNESTGIRKGWNLIIGCTSAFEGMIPLKSKGESIESRVMKSSSNTHANKDLTSER